MQILPINSYTNQSFNTVLDNYHVKVDILWCDIGNCWYLTVLDINSNKLILENQRVLKNIRMIDNMLNDVFNGDFVCIDETNNIDNLNVKSFIKDCKIIYFNRDDIDVIKNKV